MFPATLSRAPYICLRRGRGSAARLGAELLTGGGKSMEVTSKGWSEGKDVIGHVRKFGASVQRVRIPPGQSVDPQAGSKPCDDGGNPDGDT